MCGYNELTGDLILGFEVREGSLTPEMRLLEGGRRWRLGRVGGLTRAGRKRHQPQKTGCVIYIGGSERGINDEQLGTTACKLPWRGRPLEMMMKMLKWG
jgi:hypothetical protein